MSNTIPLSFLDLAPVPEGKTIAEGIAQTVAIAQQAEKSGLNRYWMAEHHNMPGIASAATSVLLSHIGSQTKRIRIGAGGVMLPNHAPLVVALDIAPLRYRKDGVEHFVAVASGFMEVKDNRVSILAPTAETEAEIDFVRAESAKERAERRIAEHAPETDVRRAELALRRALMRLKIHEFVRR